MDEENNEVLQELEQAYKDTISSTSKPQTGVARNGLSDEKQKINSLLSEIEKELDQKKAVVEGKLETLKTIKSEIESGLEELKTIGSKKEKLKEELEKIERIEKEEQEIEKEVASL